MKRIASKCAFGTLEGYIRPDQKIELSIATTLMPWYHDPRIIYEGLFKDLDSFLSKQKGKTSSWSIEHGQIYRVVAMGDILKIAVLVE